MKSIVNEKLSVIPEKLASRKCIAPTSARFFSVSNDGEESPIKWETKENCANLTPNDSILRIKMGLNFIPLKRESLARLSLNFWKKFSVNLSNYKNSNGFEELAFRYVCNLVNLRWAYENEALAKDKKVTIKILEGKNEVRYQHTFDNEFLTKNMNELRNFTYDYKSDSDISVLVEAVREVLANDKSLLSMEVSCDLSLEKGAEVYPDMYDNNKEVEFSDGKINNAISTIDTWRPEYNESLSVIPINIYGKNKATGKEYRNPEMENDFISLLDKMLDNGVESMEENEADFVMACFVRGFVYER